MKNSPANISKMNAQIPLKNSSNQCSKIKNVNTRRTNSFFRENDWSQAKNV